MTPFRTDTVKHHNKRISVWLIKPWVKMREHDDQPNNHFQYTPENKPWLSGKCPSSIGSIHRLIQTVDFPAIMFFASFRGVVVVIPKHHRLTHQHRFTGNVSGNQASRSKQEHPYWVKRSARPGTFGQDLWQGDVVITISGKDFPKNLYISKKGLRNMLDIIIQMDIIIQIDIIIPTKISIYCSISHVLLFDVWNKSWWMAPLKSQLCFVVSEYCTCFEACRQFAGMSPGVQEWTNL